MRTCGNMRMNKIIPVRFDVARTVWKMKQDFQKYVLNNDKQLVSVDTETHGIYSHEERKEARQLLKQEDLSMQTIKLLRLISSNSGLSHPSLMRTTHFIFGLSKDCSIILLPSSLEEELMIWEMMLKFEGTYLVHNALFDFLTMYHRIGVLPPNFTDTSLLAKCFLNHVDVWKAKTGLKELMSDFYDPSWALFDNHEPEDPSDPKVLQYAATDGAATFYLYELIREEWL